MPRRPTHLLRSALVVALVVLAASCGSDDGAGTGLATSTTGPGGAGALLLGRTFLGADVTGGDPPHELVPDSTLRVSFSADGGLGGTGGCNALGGSVDLGALDDGVVRAAGPLSMTEKACFPEALMAQDQWLADLLTAGADWHLDGDVLVLEADGVVLRLTDEAATRPDLPLEGTSWTVVTVIEGDAASVAPDLLAAGIVLADDGTLTVETGCRSGTGRWERGEASLTVLSLDLDDVTCEAARAALDDAVLAVLQPGTAIGVAIDGDELVLEGPDGHGLVLRGAVLADGPEVDATVPPTPTPTPTVVEPG